MHELCSRDMVGHQWAGIAERMHSMYNRNLLCNIGDIIALVLFELRCGYLQYRNRGHSVCQLCCRDVFDHTWSFGDRGMPELCSRHVFDIFRVVNVGYVS